ncbi:MAG: EthD family reductase [Deltaproteobacteria bacterium]|nr:MAG: EthD family reductase [Deltaproteobacteria bacterium]
MARMVVICRTPKDIAAFDKHYFEVHVPLAKKLPGLRKYEVSKGSIVSLAGAPESYLIATLHFDSSPAIKEVFPTARGQACAADRRLLAPDDADVQMFLFDNQEV